MSLLSHLYVVLSLKNILLLYFLISIVSFSVTNIIFLNNSNTCNQMHSWNILYGNHAIAWRTGKEVSRNFSLSTVSTFAIGSVPLLMQWVSGAVSLTEQYSTCCIKQHNFLHSVPTIRAHFFYLHYPTHTFMTCTINIICTSTHHLIHHNDCIR